MRKTGCYSACTLKMGLCRCGLRIGPHSGQADKLPSSPWAPGCHSCLIDYQPCCIETVKWICTWSRHRRAATSDTVSHLTLSALDARGLLESLPKFSSTPTYLPVEYQVLNADLSFFLKEANQDIMRNSSLQSRTEAFFVQQARQAPSLSATYGPLSIEEPIPLELLQPAGSGVPSSMFTFNWRVQAFVINERIHPGQPKVQVLFYMSGRDWDDYAAVDKLPCVKMFAFHETQEVRGTCRLRGELGLCVAELEPLAGWFSPPSVVPGRQRVPGQPDGTSIELYYMLQSAESGGCSAEELRKGGAIRSDQDGMFGPASSSPMWRIGSVRLCPDPPAPPLVEVRLNNNFVVLVPSGPLRPRDTFTAFLSSTDYSSVESFILR
ncbi:transmembrane protein 132C-like isoform X1 [Arapaima gigas]